MKLRVLPALALLACTSNPPASLAPAVMDATLVLQRVGTVCGGSSDVGWMGTDVFVRLEDDDAKAKPEKAFAFCPPKPRAPQLQMWQNCSAFASCKVDPGDPANGEVAVTCGKEHIVLKSDGVHTVLRASFGEREIAPHPMKIAPVKTESRRAAVDC